MAGTVRTATTGPIAQAGRTSGVLSDGVTLWNAVEDNGTIYIYSSTDKINWTLRTTYAPVPALTATGVWSMAQAANNDLALVWIAGVTTISVSYIRFTYAAGPTWTAGAVESALGTTTLGANPITSMGACDIAFLGGVVPAVAFSFMAAAGGFSGQRIRIRRTSDNTWQNAGAENANTGGYPCGIQNGGDTSGTNYTGKSRELMFCGEYATAVPASNLVFVGLMIRTLATTNYGLDLGDSFQIFEVNVNTAAVTSPGGTDLIIYSPSYSAAGHPTPSGQGATPRRYGLFSPGPGLFDLCMFSGASTGSFMQVWRWKTGAGGVAGGGASSYAGPAPIINGVKQAVVTQDAVTPTTVNRAGFMYVPITGTDVPVNSYTATFGLLYTYTSGGFRNTRMNAFRVWGSPSYTAGSQPYNSYLGRYWRPDIQLAHPWADDNADKQYTMASFQMPKARLSRFALGLTYNSVSKKFLLQENIRPAIVNWTPQNGGTVATDTPVLTASQTRGTTAPPNQQPWKAEIRVAKDAAFTTSLQTLYAIDTASAATYVDPAPGASAVMTLGVQTATPLTQGVWYWSSHAWDMFQESDSTWSANFTFTNSHPPSAVLLTPTGDTTYDFGAAGTVAFSFSYSDSSPTSTMSAYQIIVENNADGTTVVDTGKVLLTAAQGATNTVNVNIPGTAKDIQLRWRISVWDNENIQGAFYGGTNLFHVSDKPTVAITSPTAAQVVNTASPVIQWTFAASGGRRQASYRVVITDTVAGSVLLDSGQINGNATSYTPPTPILANNSSYSVVVSVTDTVGLANTSVPIAFTTAWSPPAAPTFSVSQTSYDASGYVAVTWTNAARDATWISWRIYRRLSGSSVNTLLAEYTTDSPTYEYDDYFVGANTQYDYAVVQVADRFGSQIESAYNWVTLTPAGTHYWLIGTDVLTNPSALKVRLSQVTAESFGEEYEASEMQIIGRGRRVDYGTRWGFKGSITAQLRTDSVSTARAKRLQLEQVRAQKAAIYLRNPFGDIWQVNVSDLQMERLAGTGSNEFCNVTIPYAEVS